MTHVIKATNVNDALPNGLWWLHTSGDVDDSRNGRVLVSPTPVITEYAKPDQRVLFSSVRDANPYFHFFESLWMLRGKDDVEFPAHFAANIATFSDDGKTIAGAYGERWRWRFGYDQLQMIIEELKKNPKTRRCVLSMWNPGFDHPLIEDGSNGDLYLAMNGGKDVPCNTQVYFDTLGGKLNMTVTCRSNDAVWGCYGANMVHFSMLLEYVAGHAEMEMGVYRQFSNNFHVYADRPDVQRLHDKTGVPSIGVDDRYATHNLEPYPLMGVPKFFDEDLWKFFDKWEASSALHAGDFVSEFFRHVAVPLWNSHLAYKMGEHGLAKNTLAHCHADDWRAACHEWLNRREEKRNANKS